MGVSAWVGNTASWCPLGAPTCLVEAGTSEGLSPIGSTWPKTCLFGVGITPQVPPQGAPSPAPKAGVRECSTPQLGTSTHYPQPSPMDSPLPNPSVPPPQNPSVSPSSKSGIPLLPCPQPRARHCPSSPQPHFPQPHSPLLPPHLPSAIVRGLPLPLSAKLIRRWRGRIM